MSCGEPAVGGFWHSLGREGTREHVEAPAHRPERGSDDDGWAHRIMATGSGFQGGLRGDTREARRADPPSFE